MSESRARSFPSAEGVPPADSASTACFAVPLFERSAPAVSEKWLVGDYEMFGGYSGVVCQEELEYNHCLLATGQAGFVRVGSGL
jgi:hypothetical protein